jgi:hypothetical protein
VLSAIRSSRVYCYADVILKQGIADIPCGRVTTGVAMAITSRGGLVWVTSKGDPSVLRDRGMLGLDRDCTSSTAWDRVAPGRPQSKRLLPKPAINMKLRCLCQARAPRLYCARLEIWTDTAGNSILQSCNKSTSVPVNQAYMHSNIVCQQSSLLLLGQQVVPP